MLEHPVFVDVVDAELDVGGDPVGGEYLLAPVWCLGNVRVEAYQLGWMGERSIPMTVSC